MTDPLPLPPLIYRSHRSEQTRAGMYKILGEDISAHLRAKDTPGVFSQGLVVYSGAGDEVLYERLLDIEIVSQVASFCEEKGVSLIAYSGDEIVSEADGLFFAHPHVCAFAARQGSKPRDRKHSAFQRRIAANCIKLAALGTA